MFAFETVVTHSYYFPDEQLLIMRLKDAEITLELTKTNFSQTYQALGDISVKSILDIRHLEFADFPKEVMAYIADSEYNKYQLSAAMIINGLSQKLLSNFYLTMFRPKVKTKIFNTLEGALEWNRVKNPEDILKSLHKVSAL